VRRTRTIRWPLAALPLGFLAFILAAPALRLLAEGGSGADVWAPWQDPYLRGRLMWSVAQAAATCVGALVLGLPMSWVLARWEFAGRRLLLRGLMLPFVVPTLVAALGVLSLWGHALQDTPWLLLYGNLFFNLCVVVRAGVDGLETVSAARLAAARTLGATPWRAFWRVEWQAVAPWIASALCLVFLYCFSGFGLALVLGGQDFATAEVEVYTLVAHELQLGQAAVLSLWMLILTALVAWGYAAVERGLATPARADKLVRRRPTGALQWAAVLATVVVWALVCAAPIWAIAEGALDSGADAFRIMTDEDTLLALRNTLGFTALSLLLATVLGLAHAWAAQQLLWLRALVYLPFVVSPVMVAFGLLLLYPQASGSMELLVAAYALLAYPFVAKSVAARLDSLPRHYTEAARSLGAGPVRCFFRVTLPLIAPALRRGMAFAAATAVGEFAVSLFLSRSEWLTLSTLIYQYLGKPGASNLAAAQLLACVLMAVALAAFTLIDWPSDEEGFHA
jgi:thiamine transport system permease protein